MTSEQITELELKLGFHFKRVKSTRIVAYAYKNNELWVIFGVNKKKSSLYRYSNISRKTFEDLDRAKSKGRWIQENLVKTKKEYKGWDLNF
jgi:hypothetical protein|nr:MAG TPA: KTSC domain [Caudoviricetes sp.]